jgi:hypothetical protein
MQIDNISVNVELVSNTLVSGGAFNGIPAYYSYASNVKRNWTFTVYISFSEYNQLLTDINFFGYNLGEFESVKGNITSVSINNSVYTKGKEYFLASVNLTEFPDYAPPNFDSSFEESYQISIAGYYVNGSGFLGNDNQIRKLLRKYGTYNIDYKTDGYQPYRMHIFPFKYDERLPFYYNNNQRFLQKRLDPNVIKKSQIFEKAEIRWVCFDDLKKMRPQFRSYFQNIIDMILNQKDSIAKFVGKRGKKKTRRNISRKSTYTKKNY